MDNTQNDNPSQDDSTQSLRNSIFAAQKAYENRNVEQQPQQQVAAPSFTGQPQTSSGLGGGLHLEIPVDRIPLPSEGKCYPQAHPLHGHTSIEFRAMTTREEDILTNQAYIKKGTVVNELVKSCLLDKSIDVNSLLAGDRNALMVAIRASGYTSRYSPTIACPACEHKQDLEVDLSQLGIKNLQIQPVQTGSNMFEFVLPVCKYKVLFRFLTGQDEENLLAEQTAKKKRGILASSLVTSRLLASIISIHGVSDRGQIARFISEMSALDSLELRQYIDKTEPGLDMSVQFDCSNCEHSEEVVLPIDASFFWPNSKRQRGVNS